MEVVGQLRVEVVYRRDHARLWRSLLAFTGDPELASEAEAEAFAQVLRRGEAVQDVAAWVWRSAFRIAIGLLGAARSHDEFVRRLAEDARLEPSHAEFLALLGSLSQQQRACVVLRYTGGFTSEEIADLIGSSAGTVRVQLHRAHATLRAELDPNEIERRLG